MRFIVTPRIVLVAVVATLSMPSPTAGQAQIVFQDTQVVLGPTPDGGAITANTSLWIVFTPSPRRQVPQGGDWTLHWPGSANLPAGHYAGRWTGNAYVESLTFDAEGVPLLVVPARFTFVMPGYGTIVSRAVNYQTGLCGITSTFTQEWHYSEIRGTGVFSGLTDLTGTAVAVAERSCS